MPVMEISVVPLGTGDASVSSYIAGALEALKGEKGIRYELTSMGTILEAESSERLLKAARKMHESLFAAGAARVVTSIKIDERRDKPLSIDGKVKAVKDKLG